MKPQITKKQIRETAIRTCAVLLGAALNAWAVDVFALPFGILMGGSTGIGRLLHSLTGLSLSGWVLACNILLLLAAWRFLGRRYASTIVLGSFSYPVFLELFARTAWARTPALEDPILAAISGGFVMGLGLGIILRVGASLGGSDVIPLITHKKFDWSISTVMYLQDTIILLLQVFQATLTEVVLAILTVFVYSAVTDRVITMGHGLVQFQIYSEYNEEILQSLIDFGVGATMIHGKSGYLRKETEMISSVVQVRNMNQIKRMILSIDPTAFITISMVKEVNGRGFTIEDENRRPDRR